jgi:hypothetical protein
MSEEGTSMTQLSWVPGACTLPSRERPLRLMEFNDLFSRALLGLTRCGPGRLRLVFDGSAEVETIAGDLTARESACCSFFEFTTVRGHGRLTLDIGVPAGHEPVLDALTAQAVAAAPDARTEAV